MAVILTGSRKSQYQARFREWGFKKYAKGTQQGDWKIARYKAEKAKKLGKKTEVYRDGKLVTPKILRRQGFTTFLEQQVLERGKSLTSRLCRGSNSNLQRQRLKPHQVSSSSSALLRRETDISMAPRLRLIAPQQLVRAYQWIHQDTRGHRLLFR